jgi:hypothetical protein
VRLPATVIGLQDGEGEALRVPVPDGRRLPEALALAAGLADAEAPALWVAVALPAPLGLPAALGVKEATAGQGEPEEVREAVGDAGGR